MEEEIIIIDGNTIPSQMPDANSNGMFHSVLRLLGKQTEVPIVATPKADESETLNWIDNVINDETISFLDEVTQNIQPDALLECLTSSCPSSPSSSIIQPESPLDVFGENLSSPLSMPPPASPSTPPSSPTEGKMFMKKFPEDQLLDLKHIVYNMLVDHYNGNASYAQPCTMEVKGVLRHGFRFVGNNDQQPEDFLPEFYALFIRNSRLDLAKFDQPLMQDLYKFYLRSFTDLLAKYFVKVDKYTFLYEGEPLFIPGEKLAEAEERLSSMKSLARKRALDKPSSNKKPTKCARRN